MNRVPYLGKLPWRGGGRGVFMPPVFFPTAQASLLTSSWAPSGSPGALCLFSTGAGCSFGLRSPSVFLQDSAQSQGPVASPTGQDPHRQTPSQFSSPQVGREVTTKVSGMLIHAS